MEIDFNNQSLGSRELGFRLRVEIHYPEEPARKKYFIFLNKNEWSEINDVIQHIQTIFDISRDIDIYIDDVLLPRKETIHLIEKTDTLIVKILNDKRQSNHNNALNISNIDNKLYNQSLSTENKPKKKSKKRSYETNEDTKVEISKCMEELNRKRIDLLKLEPDPGNYNNDCAIKVDDVNCSNENHSGAPDEESYQPKRKRKRRRKPTSMNVDSVGEFVEELSNNSVKIEPDKEEISTNNHQIENRLSQKHIFFPEGGDDAEETTSTPNKRDSIDVFARLVGLANKPKYEKVFTRKTDHAVKMEPESEDKNSTFISAENNISPSPTNKKSPSSSIIETPKVGDVITFTKLKIGKDYCPEPSGPIVGKVIRIHTLPDKPKVKQIGLEILQGSEEFGVPEGKFSLDEEDVLQGNIPQIHVVELNWHEILEPRLYNSQIPVRSYVKTF